MPTKLQKNKTFDYLAAKLEQAGLYTLQRTGNNSLLIRESHSAEQPKTYSVVIPNFFPRISDFKDSFQQNRTHGIFTAPIFYKDGDTAFALLQDTPKFWEHDQTLKLYTAEQKHTILHLRDLERFVLEQFGKDITYYQPQTARLQESVRVFTLADVHLDYSHIPPEDPKYSRVQNRTSLDYKLPFERPTLGPALAVETFSEHDTYKRARLISMDVMTNELWESITGPSKETIIAELQASAQHAYPGLPPEDALIIYSGGKI